MLKRFAAIVICAGCCFTALPAMADGWNFGVKLAYFEVDADGVDDPDNVGLVVNYDWVQDYGVVGIEGDVTGTFEDGTVGGEDVSVDTLGVHATYKTLGPSGQGLGAYLKVKAGVLYYDIDAGASPATEDKVEASFGVGVGVNMGHVAFELELVTIRDGEMVSFAILF